MVNETIYNYYARIVMPLKVIRNGETSMQSNRIVLLGGAVIIVVGFVKASTSGGSPTRVFAGGVGIVLLASLLELAGNAGSRLASGLVGIATLTVILVEAPSIYQAIAKGTQNAHNPFSSSTGSNQSQNTSGSQQTTSQNTGSTTHTSVKPLHGAY
jgi:hypothetical protein